MYCLQNNIVRHLDFFLSQQLLCFALSEKYIPEFIASRLSTYLTPITLLPVYVELSSFCQRFLDNIPNVKILYMTQIPSQQQIHIFTTGITIYKIFIDTNLALIFT